MEGSPIRNVDTAHPTAIEVDVLLELRDYLRANYWFLFRRFRFFILMLSVVGIAYPILYLTGSLGQPAESSHQSNWGFLIPVGVLVIVIASVYFGSKKSLASNRSLQENIHYTFSESGINANAESSSGRQGWENFREAIETKNNFMLFLADRLIYVIPKRCFRNADQTKEFRALLLDRLGSKAKLKH